MPEFLKNLMAEQVIFEKTRVGTDGSLYEKNTVEFGLQRGVIGEAQEALEELAYLYELQILTPDAEELIKKTYEKLQMELVDIQIFLASVFVHAGMTADQVEALVASKLQTNRKKYDPRNFEGKTIAEGVQFSRDEWNRNKKAVLDSSLEPSYNGSGKEPQEFEDTTVYAGSLT